MDVKENWSPEDKAALDRGIEPQYLRFFKDNEKYRDIYEFLTIFPLYLDPTKSAPSQWNFQTVPNPDIKNAGLWLAVYIVKTMASSPPKMKEVTEQIKRVAQIASQRKLQPLDMCYLKALIAKDYTTVTPTMIVGRPYEEIIEILTTGYQKPFVSYNDYKVKQSVLLKEHVDARKMQFS